MERKAGGCWIHKWEYLLEEGENDPLKGHRIRYCKKCGWQQDLGIYK